MNWFSLPITQADNTAAFFDADSARRWLGGQPQANVPVMLASLTRQSEAFNTFSAPPVKRFETLEVLRKSFFALTAESRRRYEHKRLPLLPAEHSVFDSVRRLWRAATIGYLHCLQACLDGDPSIAPHAAVLTHRVLSCLRMEQMHCYLVAAEPDGDFWRILHSVWAHTESLGLAGQPQADRLLGETRESTVSGQYCMALMLHLVRPYALSRRQFAAATRWLARWRELARVLGEPEAEAKSVSSCSVALDLSSAQPIEDSFRTARVGRRLVLDAVLRKMRERGRLLASGQSPESLKLGSALSSQECMNLLEALADHLQHPQALTVPSLPDDGESVVLAAGLENAYRLLGGARIDDVLELSTSSSASHLVVEQIAVFGHVVRQTDPSSERAAEIWWVVSLEAGELQLMRHPGRTDVRLLVDDLLALRPPGQRDHVLATINGLRVSHDGHLWVSARLLAGKPIPLMAEVREKTGGKLSRHGAVWLAAGEGAQESLMFLPAGLSPQALSISFRDALGQPVPALRLMECLFHGDDHERWSLDAGRLHQI